MTDLSFIKRLTGVKCPECKQPAIIYAKDSQWLYCACPVCLFLWNYTADPDSPFPVIPFLTVTCKDYREVIKRINWRIGALKG